MIINDPFLSPSKARAMVNERFHEVLTTKRHDGLVPEAGESTLMNRSLPNHLPI